jgi:hypothetical protein
MKREPLEKVTVVRVMVALRKIPGLVVRKRHGSVMGVAGDPDLYGSYRGKHFEIEIKRPHDSRSQLTKLQTERQKEWKVEGGAIVGVARSPEEALAILGLRPPEPPRWICTGCRNFTWASDDAPARCPNCGHIHFEREAA